MAVGEKLRISLTGNPFVDTGLAVIAALADLDDVQQLTVDALRKVHGDGSQLASWNSSLKNFTMIFTNNSLLTNPSIKDKTTRGRIYGDVLGGLLNKIGSEGLPYRCESCGAVRSVDFDQLCRTALVGAGMKEQPRFIGRDWFPLSGSLGSDAQALPSASRPVRLCAKCLFAVHYLPLGLILLDGRLAAFQSTSIDFWYELVRDIINGDGGMKTRLMAGVYETPGAKEGTRTVARRLLALFQQLQRANRLGEIPPGTALQVWRFTNSGPPPRDGITCQIEEIPNPALVFLWDAVRNGLRKEVENLIDSEGKKERPLFRCIAERRDYSKLYPRGKNGGASPKLFTLYQTEVCGRSTRALAIAQMLARQATHGLKSKDIKRLQREEAFSDRSVRIQFRALMANFAQHGKFTLDDYLGLFPLREDDSGITVRFDGWNLIRYYLHHSEDSKPLMSGSLSQPIVIPKLAMLRYYAACIFSSYVEERGRDRFQTDVLKRIVRGEIGASWLRRQFLSVAEQHDGFTYGAWQRLCTNNSGQLFVNELLFQMRLLWIEWLEKSELPRVDMPMFEHRSGLPAMIENSLKEAFLQYVKQRGLQRFRREVLVRLHHNEIGLAWFGRQLVQGQEGASLETALSEDDWEEFLKDEEGHPCSRDRLFQMHLMLANLYREAK